VPGRHADDDFLFGVTGAIAGVLVSGTPHVRPSWWQLGAACAMALRIVAINAGLLAEPRRAGHSRFQLPRASRLRSTSADAAAGGWSSIRSRSDAVIIRVVVGNCSLSSPAAP
jgi:hypothetical protein